MAAVSRRTWGTSEKEFEVKETDADVESDVEDVSVTSTTPTEENNNPPAPGMISKLGSGLVAGTTGVVSFGYGTLCSVASTGAGVVGKIPGAGWFSRGSTNTPAPATTPSPTSQTAPPPQVGKAITADTVTSSDPPRSACPPKSKGWFAKGKDKDD